MWLVEYLKSLVSVHLGTVKTLNSLKTCTTALPSYCFITSAKIELENVRLSLSGTLGVFVNTSTAVDKYSLRNGKNLPQLFQLQLSEKQANVSHLFAEYLKSTSNIEHFERKR